MHPTQRNVILMVDESISLLSRRLMQEYDICEDDALDILRDTENLTDDIQEGNLDEVYKKAKVRAVNLPNNPREYYPGHHAFMPPLTFSGTFNQHMAQALTPYAKAIAKKIALDRGIEQPSTKEMEQALAQVDWAKAAYEAQKIKKNPGKIRSFLRKYFAAPIGKVTDKIQVERLFAMATAGTMMWLLWTTFKNHLHQIGSPPGDVLLTYGDYKQRQQNKQVFRTLLGKKSPWG